MSDDARKLEELREEMEADKMPDAVTGLPGRAQEAAHQAATQASQQMDTLGGVIREHPLTAVAIGLGVGYLLGHLTT